MSRASSNRGPKPAPQLDVYVGLMMMSTACLIAGIVFLVLALQSYT
ncbi:MAG: hypothetical protein KDA78_02365 [Planctomycetaceae bacterium]|nr:hypothetical protein [Planctomycetaceae bacterium]